MGSGVSSASYGGMNATRWAAQALAPAPAPELAAALGADGPDAPPLEGESPSSGCWVFADPPAPPPRARRPRFSDIWWAYQVAPDKIFVPLCPPSVRTNQE